MDALRIVGKRLEETKIGFTGGRCGEDRVPNMQGLYQYSVDHSAAGLTSRLGPDGPRKLRLNPGYSLKMEY